MLGKKSTDTKINTLIGAGAELNGDFTLDGSARIDGKIGGNVTVTGSLILGAGSVVTGEVQAASVLIGGEVTGNITAPEKAELTASAKVLGDIATKVIVIDEHAKGCNCRSTERSGRGRKERKSGKYSSAGTDAKYGGRRNSKIRYKKKTLGIICQRLFSPYVRIPVHNRHCHNSENDSLC